MKKAILAHGWDGTPEEGWFPWLKKELEVRGFAVVVPQLPETAEPRKEAWVPTLAAAVGTPDRETVLVGHSMGCQTIARYLATLPADTKIGGVVYVAGFFKRLTGLESAEEQEITDSWLAAPIDLAAVAAHGPSIAIFSDNDPFVPVDNIDDFRAQLGSEIVMAKDAGHFNEKIGCFELPIALESVLKLVS